MAPNARLVLHSLVFWSCLVAIAYGRQSSWSMTFSQGNFSIFKVEPNYMYKGSFVAVSALCDSVDVATVPLEISWILQRVDCVQEFYQANTNSTGLLVETLTRLHFDFAKDASTTWTPPVNSSEVIGSTYFQSALYTSFNCNKQNFITLPDESRSPYFEAQFYDGEPKAQFRRIDRNMERNETEKGNLRVATIWEDGMYHFLIKVRALNNANFVASVRVMMKGSYGLLSAIEWPLLVVSGGMALFYLTAGTLWIFIWAKSQEHTQKIHIVIGAIAVAGALGHTLSFADMSVRNSDGVGIYGVYWVGNFVSAVQLSLTLLLIMIVSTGFGINRPTLSPSHLRTMVALTAFIFASKFALLIVSDETLQIKYNFPNLFALISVINLIVMLTVTGWIMVFSINTFIYLFQRQHSSESKLNVFCIFMACCISVFLSHFVLGVVILSDKGWFKDCRKNWKQEWIATSVNQLLVFILLTVLMWLWRPMDERMSYGFEPLSTTEPPAEEDESADEKEKIMLEEI